MSLMGHEVRTWFTSSAKLRHTHPFDGGSLSKASIPSLLRFRAATSSRRATRETVTRLFVLQAARSALRRSGDGGKPGLPRTRRSANAALRDLGQHALREIDSLLQLGLGLAQRGHFVFERSDLGVQLRAPLGS